MCRICLNMVLKLLRPMLSLCFLPDGVVLFFIELPFMNPLIMELCRSLNDCLRQGLTRMLWMTIKFLCCSPNTPLHFAAFAGNFLIVEHLLLIGVDLRAQTIDHKTPLDMAIEMRRSSVLGVLELFIGSDPRYSDFLDEFNKLMNKTNE